MTRTNKKIIICFALFAILCLSLLSCGEKENHSLVFYNGDAIYHSVEISDCSSVTMPSPPTKEGYAFDGWYFDKDVWNNPLTDDYSFTNTPQSDLSVYAKWSPIIYTVTFTANGETVDTRTYTYDNKVLETIPEIPKKEGFFSIWEDFELNCENITVEAIYKGRAVVTIRSNIDGAIKFTGQTTQNVSAHSPSIKDVEIEANFGYNLLYYEINGEKFESNVISYDNITSDTEIIVYAEYATYELPIMSISTNGAAINSKVDYTDMTFTMLNSEDNMANVTGGIRLRGNSTMGYPKKPYRIKFDKKQSFFGLAAAKSWVLLAEYLDPSAINNYTAFTLANKLDGFGFNPTPHKVNVYINGEYQGLYTLCEQVQENKGRIGIELDEITADMTELRDFNFFICMDKSVTGDIDAVEGETYFHIPIPNYNGDESEKDHIMTIELKYPEKDQFASDEQFEKFMEDLREYMIYILDILAKEDAEAMKKELNMNSLIDYLILDQIMNEDDHHFKSFNMYFTNTSDKEEENGKLSFGPVWDYDYSMGIPWQGKPNQHFKMSDRVFYSNIFFRCTANIPEFYEIIKERYNTYAKPALEEYIANCDALTNSMKESVALNQDRWYDDIDPYLSIKNIAFVKDCLKYRLALLNELWK